MKMLRLKDNVKIKINDAVFVVRQLTQAEKLEWKSFTRIVEGKIIAESEKMAHYLIKHSLIEVHGLVECDETDYRLEFENDTGLLSDDCTQEILNLLVSQSLIYATMGLMSGNHDKVIDPLTNQPIEGVEMEIFRPK